MNKHKIVHNFIIGTFVTLYLLTSTISTIHVVSFFELSNATWLAITLAIAFEIGAAASLASLIVLEKMNRGMVYLLFIVLTLMQAMGNTFYAYSHLHNFQGWIELFGLTDYEVIEQKRILAIVSGAVLPLVALGFIKSLVDYIKPDVEDSVYNTDVPKPIEIEQPQIINTAEVVGTTEPIAPIVEEPIIEKPMVVETLSEANIEKLIGEEDTEIFYVPEIPEVEAEPAWEEIDEAPDTDLIEPIIEEEIEDKKKTK